MKTLVFCTSYASDNDTWENRYHSWVKHHNSIGLNMDLMLLSDDGSPCDPEFDYSNIMMLVHPGNLGRPDSLDYPGWYRSFAGAIEFGVKNNFEKIIHIESDARILSPRLIKSINEQTLGWRTFWCPTHHMPESAIQVIGLDQIKNAYEQTREPYETFKGFAAERYLKFTEVDMTFKGDRYGEFQSFIPEDADYATQITGEYR